MSKLKLPIYKPKITDVEFNCKHIPRGLTKGVKIKADDVNYSKKNIAHAYIHLNGKIELGLNQDMISEGDEDYLIVKLLIKYTNDSQKIYNESLKGIISTTDWLLASQLDALAWLCRKWFKDYETDEIAYEVGDLFPKKLLNKYIANEGFTRYV
tara:strand:+ start:365 stop:826 length:462 start_codon:yes stop_codon:yes gene_type:complete